MRTRFGPVLVLLTAMPVFAQVDFSGEWSPRFYEDQPERVPGPELGDYLGLPINAAARMRADTWSASLLTLPEWQCRPHSADYIWRGPSQLRISKEVDPVTREVVAWHAEWLRSIDRKIYMDDRPHPQRMPSMPGLMRVPGRLHITWENDDILKVETDAGTQTRRLRFGAVQAAAGTPDWQGTSAAQWEFAGGRRGGPAGGNLKVVTTHMRSGYLQKNGVPYSGNAVVTEYFHTTTESSGDSWLLVTTLVEDPQYLTGPFQRSTHYKKQLNANGWNPSPCTAR